VGRSRPLLWLGVDVGGARKGFDAAVVDERRLIGAWRRCDRDAVVAIVDRVAPVVVAIDSPCGCAADGETARPGERELARAVCGIRWTPDEAEVRGNPYYGWVVEGLALYEALAARGVQAIEVFPTASWTRWHGPRGTERRSNWSRAALTGLGLEGVPTRTSQDLRDAIAAAVTARAYSQGITESFGEIVVPL